LSQGNGQRRTPRSAADDGNFFHDFLRLNSKRGSVPARRRSILSRCFTMTTTAARSVLAEIAVGGAWLGA
jgi:hypothetical protein